MKVLSLFDGISCGMVALERAGIPVEAYFASEIDSNAIRISEKNYPNIIRLGDVKSIDVNTLPHIDLLIGGSPCQGFTRNGKMLNFNDSRSVLFFEYVRILNDLRKKNPNIKFLLENVKMKKDYVETISGYLGVEPIEINSKVLSAQNRERLYWTNIPLEDIIPKDIPLWSILDIVDTECFVKYKTLEIDPRISYKSRLLIQVVNGEVRIKQATKLGYIVAEHGDGINLIYPTSKTKRGRVIRQKSSCLDTGCEACVFYNNIIRRFTIPELERLQTLPSGYTQAAGVSDRAIKKAIGNGWTVDVIAHIFTQLKELTE